jgi:DNA-binding response OmpR family regulator
VASEPSTGESLVRHLRQLEEVAVWIDSGEAALDMMKVVEFALVIVDVNGAADWAICRRLVASGRPVAVVTRLLVRDRRYRTHAFRMGIAAYVCKPCTQSRLREMLRRVRSDERYIEIVDGAAYCES